MSQKEAELPAETMCQIHPGAASERGRHPENMRQVASSARTTPESRTKQVAEGPQSGGK